jgi:PBP1b-binding outer membrane lipoprotein LpoB
MKKLIIVFVIILTVSSCKTTESVVNNPEPISLEQSKFDSFEASEMWFDSIHSRPIDISSPENLVSK